LYALMVSQTALGKVTFLGDFESGDLKGWGLESPGDDRCRIVTEPVRSGKYAVRFECTKDQKDVANSKRCEIVQMNSGGPNNANRDCWFGWSLYIPKDWESDPQSPENVTQWHELPDTEIGETWRSPPLALAVKGEQFNFHVRWDSRAKTPGNNPEGTENLPAGGIERGQWTDWVLHIRWSFEKDDGLIEVWKNGQKIITRKGPNGYNDRRETYFKAGVYKWEWKSNPRNSITSRRVIYVDEVRFGDKDASYEEVAPRPANNGALQSK
ncbi:MAG TPA: polysaccharide lyase, partial [Tepidisphaeraceae bacterium]|nr:polysaccharide lyase [Tepidisphaeraceae bacterium]